MSSRGEMSSPCFTIAIAACSRVNDDDMGAVSVPCLLWCVCVEPSCKSMLCKLYLPCTLRNDITVTTTRLALRNDGIVGL